MSTVALAPVWSIAGKVSTDAGELLPYYRRTVHIFGQDVGNCLGVTAKGRVGTPDVCPVIVNV